MSMQKDIIDRIMEQGGDFLIELKANQRSLRYGVEDSLQGLTPVYTYTHGPELGHGRIETRTYRIIKRKSPKAARNPDTIQRIVLPVFSIWKGLRKKRSDKRKGVAELMRHLSMSFTKLLRFLCQERAVNILTIHSA